MYDDCLDNDTEMTVSGDDTERKLQRICPKDLSFICPDPAIKVRSETIVSSLIFLIFLVLTISLTSPGKLNNQWTIRAAFATKVNP